jgi:hypothetical protein
MSIEKNNTFYLNSDENIDQKLDLLLSAQQKVALQNYGIKTETPDHFMALLCHRELDQTLSNILGIDEIGFQIILKAFDMANHQSTINIEENIFTGFKPQGVHS